MAETVQSFQNKQLGVAINASDESTSDGNDEKRGRQRTSSRLSKMEHCEQLIDTEQNRETGSTNSASPRRAAKSGEMLRSSGDKAGVVNDDLKLRISQIQRNLEKNLSDESKEKILSIVGKVVELSDVEKLLLYMQLPGSDSSYTSPKTNVKLECTQAMSWIVSHFEEDPDTSLLKSQMYEDYKGHCERENIKALKFGEFNRVARLAFPSAKPRRLGNRGQPRYCLSGVNSRASLPTVSLPQLDLSAHDDHKLDKESETGDTESGDIDEDVSSSSAQSLICEWAKKLFSQSFTSSHQLAQYLVKNGYVNGASLEAFTVQATAPPPPQADTDNKTTPSTKGKEAETEVPMDQHRALQLKLQRKLQERALLSQQKRLMEEQRNQTKEPHVKDDSPVNTTKVSKQAINNVAEKDPANSDSKCQKKSAPVTPQKLILPKTSSSQIHRLSNFTSGLHGIVALPSTSNKLNGKKPCSVNKQHQVFFISNQPPCSSIPSSSSTTPVMILSPVTGAQDQSQIAPLPIQPASPKVSLPVATVAVPTKSSQKPDTKVAPCPSLASSHTTPQLASVSIAGPQPELPQDSPKTLSNLLQHDFQTNSPSTSGQEFFENLKTSGLPCSSKLISQLCAVDVSPSNSPGGDVDTKEEVKVDVHQGETSPDCSGVSYKLPYALDSTFASPVTGKDTSVLSTNSIGAGASVASEQSVSVSSTPMSVTSPVISQPVTVSSCEKNFSQRNASAVNKPRLMGKTVSDLLKEQRGPGDGDKNCYVNDKRPVAQILKETRQRQKQMQTAIAGNQPVLGTAILASPSASNNQPIIVQTVQLPSKPTSTSVQQSVGINSTCSANADLSRNPSTTTQGPQSGTDTHLRKILSRPCSNPKLRDLLNAKDDFSIFCRRNNRLTTEVKTATQQASVPAPVRTLSLHKDLQAGIESSRAMPIPSTDLHAGIESSRAMATPSTDLQAGIESSRAMAMPSTDLQAGIESSRAMVMPSTDLQAGIESSRAMAIPSTDLQSGIESSRAMAIPSTDLQSGIESSRAMAIPSTPPTITGTHDTVKQEEMSNLTITSDKSEHDLNYEVEKLLLVSQSEQRRSAMKRAASEPPFRQLIPHKQVIMDSQPYSQVDNSMSADFGVLPQFSMETDPASSDMGYPMDELDQGTQQSFMTHGLASDDNSVLGDLGYITPTMTDMEATPQNTFQNTDIPGSANEMHQRRAKTFPNGKTIHQLLQMRNNPQDSHNHISMANLHPDLQLPNAYQIMPTQNKYQQTPTPTSMILSTTPTVLPSSALGSARKAQAPMEPMSSPIVVGPSGWPISADDSSQYTGQPALDGTSFVPIKTSVDRVNAGLPYAQPERMAPSLLQSGNKLNRDFVPCCSVQTSPMQSPVAVGSILSSMLSTQQFAPASSIRPVKRGRGGTTMGGVAIMGGVGIGGGSAGGISGSAGGLVTRGAGGIAGSAGGVVTGGVPGGLARGSPGGAATTGGAGGRSGSSRKRHHSAQDSFLLKASLRAGTKEEPTLVCPPSVETPSYNTQVTELTQPVMVDQSSSVNAIQSPFSPEIHDILVGGAQLGVSGEYRSHSVPAHCMAARQPQPHERYDMLTPGGQYPGSVPPSELGSLLHDKLQQGDQCRGVHTLTDQHMVARKNLNQVLGDDSKLCGLLGTGRGDHLISGAPFRPPLKYALGYPSKDMKMLESMSELKRVCLNSSFAAVNSDTSVHSANHAPEFTADMVAPATSTGAYTVDSGVVHVGGSDLDRHAGLGVSDLDSLSNTLLACDDTQEPNSDLIQTQNIDSFAWD